MMALSSSSSFSSSSCSLNDLLQFISVNWIDYPNYEIANIYLFGSRLYQTYTDDSDYDFIVLVQGGFYPGPVLIEKNNINVNIFHLDYVRRLMNDNVVWLLMLLWVPSNCLWMEKVKFENVTIRKILLRKMILMDAFHNYNKAKRWWTVNRHTAKKNILHGLRWYNFGFQILKHGKIVDYAAVNDEWLWLNSNTSDDWDDYDKRYRAMYTSLSQQMTHQTAAKPLKHKKKRNRLWLIDYIEVFGLEALSTELCISYQRHHRYPNLVQFSIDPLNSPEDSLVVRDCPGLILDESDNWKIIAKGYPLFFSHTDAKQVAPLDWKTVRIFEKIDGLLAILYFYDNQWHVASTHSPDGSEDIVTWVSGERLYYDPRRPVYNAWKFFSDDIIKDHRSSPFLQNDENSYYPNFPEHISGSDPNVKKLETSFAAAFWKLWEESSFELPPPPPMEGEEPKSGGRACCYLFDLFSDKLRFTVARGRLSQALHPSLTQPPTVPPAPLEASPPAIVFHGTHNLDTLTIALPPQSPDCLPSPTWISVQELLNPWSLPDFPNPKTTFLYARYINPVICKGFVAVDATGNRVKYKSPAYVALKKICWSADNEKSVFKSIMLMILSNTNHDFLKRFSQFTSIYLQVVEHYKLISSTILNEYKKVSHMDIEDFKKQIKGIPFEATLFKFRNKTVQNEEDVRGVFCDMPFRLFENVMKQVEEWRKSIDVVTSTAVSEV